MHLHYLIDKKNRNCVVTEGVVAAERTIDGELWLGALLPAGKSNRIVLPRASDHPHIQTGVDDPCWLAIAGGKFGKDSARLRLSFVVGGDVVHREFKLVAGVPTMLRLPSLFDLPDPFACADLVLEVDRAAVDVFVGSSRRVPRDSLLRLARGVGVEIGPGPRPQVHNSRTTQVTYVEEMPAERWLEMYKDDVDAGAWDRCGYKLGKAHDLPVADGSLDFVFSSHVLEHLWNPLGHFDHWRRKLKPGGLVLVVVPAADGTKDFMLAPTSSEQLAEEHRSGRFDVPLSSYQRWVREHRFLGDQDALARQRFAERYSIHVHVYDWVTITNLLRHCVARHGYASFRIQYKRNSKDMIFALKADGAKSEREAGA